MYASMLCCLPVEQVVEQMKMQNKTWRTLAFSIVFIVLATVVFRMTARDRSSSYLLLTRQTERINGYLSTFFSFAYF